MLVATQYKGILDSMGVGSFDVVLEADRAIAGGSRGVRGLGVELLPNDGESVGPGNPIGSSA